MKATDFESAASAIPPPGQGVERQRSLPPMTRRLLRQLVRRLVRRLVMAALFAAVVAAVRDRVIRAHEATLDLLRR